MNRFLKNFGTTAARQSFPAFKSGAEIKKSIKSTLSKKYGELDTRHLFDTIDDKDIEDNIETAENTIKTNIDKGILGKDFAAKLPNLRDGLALSYAAANIGNGKDTKMAREAAYTEDVPLVGETGTKLLSTQPPRIENDVSETGQKPSLEKALLTKLVSDDIKNQTLNNMRLDINTSWQNRGFITHLDEVVYKKENNIPLTEEDKQHNFEASDNQDLYYSIHGCHFDIDNISYNEDGTRDISVHISDNYDYTQIWTSMEGKEFSPSRISLGTLANDLGTITSKFDAINPYKVDIYFTIRR